MWTTRQWQQYLIQELVEKSSYKMYQGKWHSLQLNTNLESKQSTFRELVIESQTGSQDGMNQERVGNSETWQETVVSNKSEQGTTYYILIINGNSISAAVALAQLDLEVAATKGQAVKESTKKNLLTHLGAYQKFCERYMLQYFPCDNRQLCRFGQHLGRTFESPESIGCAPCWH